MGLILPYMIAADISFTLVDDVVNTTIAEVIVAGVQTVTPSNMLGIYQGCRLVVGSGATQESITVISVTAATMTADFMNAHAANEGLTGATFPSGFPSNQLFTQSQILSFMAESQNDFLLKTQILYTTGVVSIKVGTRIYALPVDCIRLERISIDSVELYDVSQTDLDLADSTWQNDTTSPNPGYWYQDKVGVQKFGVGPQPQVGSTAKLFYSKRADATLDLLTPLLVPDVMSHALKYGALAKCFYSENDQRDPDRAQYCQRRFDFLVLMASKFMRGVGGRMKDPEETVEPLVAAGGQ